MAGRPTNDLPYAKESWFKSGGREPRGELTELQKEFIEFLLNPSPDKGSANAWSKSHGINEASLYNWKKNKLFREVWERRAAELNGGVERTQKVVDALYEKALSGDVKAMTVYLGYIEKFAPKPINRRDLDLTDLSDEEVAQLAENVVALRNKTA